MIEWAEKKRATEDVSRFAVATTLEGGKTMEYVYDVKNARVLHREHRVGYQAGGTAYFGVPAPFRVIIFPHGLTKNGLI